MGQVRFEASQPPSQPHTDPLYLARPCSFIHVHGRASACSRSAVTRIAEKAQTHPARPCLTPRPVWRSDVLIGADGIWSNVRATMTNVRHARGLSGHARGLSGSVGACKGSVGHSRGMPGVCRVWKMAAPRVSHQHPTSVISNAISRRLPTVTSCFSHPTSPAVPATDPILDHPQPP